MLTLNDKTEEQSKIESSNLISTYRSLYFFMPFAENFSSSTFTARCPFIWALTCNCYIIVAY